MVAIVTRLKWAGQFGAQILAGMRDSSLLQMVHTSSGGLPSPLFSGYEGSLLGVKRSGCDVDHFPPSSAEVKNEWSYTSSPPIYLHRLDMAKFTITVLNTAA